MIQYHLHFKFLNAYCCIYVFFLEKEKTIGLVTKGSPLPFVDSILPLRLPPSPGRPLHMHTYCVLLSVW